MRQIIYCYGDGHPMMLNCDTINDADRSEILRHLTSPIRSQAVSSKSCKRCGHPGHWHSHDDEKCLSTHPQPCSLPGTLDAQRGAPLAPFRCLGYDCMGEGFPAGTPESRCGCPDFIEETEGRA
jgi:hypothetical protein